MGRNRRKLRSFGLIIININITKHIYIEMILKFNSSRKNNIKILLLIIIVALVIIGLIIVQKSITITILD